MVDKVTHFLCGEIALVETVSNKLMLSLCWRSICLILY
jgi:hypothetical protein